MFNPILLSTVTSPFKNRPKETSRHHHLPKGDPAGNDSTCPRNCDQLTRGGGGGGKCTWCLIPSELSHFTGKVRNCELNKLQDTTALPPTEVFQLLLTNTKRFLYTFIFLVFSRLDAWPPGAMVRNLSAAVTCTEEF